MYGSEHFWRQLRHNVMGILFFFLFFGEGPWHKRNPLLGRRREKVCFPSPWFPCSLQAAQYAYPLFFPPVLTLFPPRCSQWAWSPILISNDAALQGHGLCSVPMSADSLNRARGPGRTLSNHKVSPKLNDCMAYPSVVLPTFVPYSPGYMRPFTAHGQRLPQV
jgi:hypothetical protein